VALLPGCDALTVQLPVLFRATIAEETPDESIDWLPLTMEQDPAALKLTCRPVGGFGEMFDTAVAVTVSCELEINTELGNEPRMIVSPTVSTAGGDGALWRGVELVVSGTSVVAIV
jgi:hypothetical protein